MTTALLSAATPLSFAETGAGYETMLDDAAPAECSEIVASISEGVLAQAGVYEDRIQSISQRMADRPDAKGREQLIIERNAVLRAMQQDLAFVDGLMERWHVRQQPQAHRTLRELERRYYNLEGNPLKYIPMYAFNFGNSICTLMVAMAVLSVLNTSVPFLHESYPDTFNKVADPHAHWNKDSFLNLFRQIGVFGLCFDLVYAGAKGLYAPNTNAAPARYWNGLLDTLGLGYKAVEPAVDLADKALHGLAPRAWEVASRYLYRGSRIGAIGIVRQLGRDIRVSFNDMAARVLRFFSKDAPQIRPFGRIGDMKLGLLLGGLFDWLVGIIENVMQNIIVKMPGNSLAGKVGLALQDPVGLVAKNALPSAACNVMHSNATARVSQHPGNDVMNAVMSRFVLGVIKGGLLTAVIATPAINSKAEHTIALYLAAQVFIGGNSIMLSHLMTHRYVRERVSLTAQSVRERMSLLFAGIFSSK